MGVDGVRDSLLTVQVFGVKVRCRCQKKSERLACRASLTKQQQTGQGYLRCTVVRITIERKG